MESIFSFLFKYRPILFQEGEIVLATPWPVMLVMAAGALVAVGAVLTYGSESGKTTRADRSILATLRLLALGILVFGLLQPTLVLTSVVAQRNFVGILLDDSRSMSLPDDEGDPRRDFIDQTFGPEGSDLVSELSERFSLRFFRFSEDANRIAHAGDLNYNGTRTSLTRALDQARQELSSVPLSGLVVLTDGADNGGSPLAEALVPLQAASIPVYTVGLGAEALSPDLQIGRVEVPRNVLKGSTLMVDVVVTHRGYRGQTVNVLVEDGNRRIADEPVTLEGNGEPTIAQIRITLETAGPRRLRFSIPRRDDEAVTQNNVREVLVDVRERREKVLYFEGEPRYEVKFLRRAIEDDANMQVVVLQRTAEGKFLRLGVDDGDELSGGFPRTREELFEYQALIIGSVEASFFTADQLSMIADFASRRGGGLLFLGGRRSFAEGGYTGTALEDAYPILLEEPAQDPRAAFAEVQVRPTNAGRSHPIAQILPSRPAAPDADAPDAGTVDGAPATIADAWASLPALTTMNRIVRTKPGATTLLTGDADGEERVVLAYHRYGRGKVLALPVQDTWLWQMHYDIPVEDTRHELLWQQLLRWLVDGVPDPVSVTPDREAIEPGETVTLSAMALDSAYLEINSASVTATLTSPSGEVFIEPMTWTVEEDGVYAAPFSATEVGTWSVEVVGVANELPLGTGVAFFQVGPSDEEYFDAGRRTNLLSRLAEDTGGRFYTVDNVNQLAEDLRFTGAGVTMTEERDLWDMPLLFLMLVGLVGAEWGFRRMRGMV